MLIASLIALLALPFAIQKPAPPKLAPATPSITPPKPAPGALMFDFDDPKKVSGIGLSIDAPLEPVFGFASGVAGNAYFDPAHPELTTGALRVPVESITFTHPGYSSSVRNYGLNAAKYPNLTCVLKRIISGKIVRPGEYEGIVLVDFTMKGVTRELSVPLRVRYLPGAARERDGKNDGDLLVVRTTFTVKRSDFGVAPEVPHELASDDVEIRVGVVGTHVRTSGKPTPPRKPDPGGLSLNVKGESFPIEARMALHGVPGCSVALVKAGEIVWVKHFGTVGNDTGMFVNEKSLFPAGAMGWPIAAAIALRLAQDKKINLDTDINRYLKGWKTQQPVTVRQLLTNKSGFAFHKYPGYNPDSPRPTLVQILNGAAPASTPPARQISAPGTTFALAGENLTVLQKTLEDATGRTWQQLFRDVFGPADSLYTAFPPDRTYIRFARGFDDSGAPIPAGGRAYPELAASGLWTCAEEFASFMAALMKARHTNSTLLDAAHARLIFATVVEPRGDDDGNALAFGIESGRPLTSLYRGGNTGGYYAMTTLFPDSDSAIIFFANRNLCWQFANEVRDSLARENGWYAPR